MRVLLVSPSRVELAFLEKALRESAHSVQSTDDLRDGLHLGGLEPYDTVIVVAIDRGAYETLMHLLHQFAKLPASPAVITIFSDATARERAVALRSGADACFVAPYSIMELQERMRVLRRGFCGGTKEAVNRIRLESATREVVEGNLRIPVGKREFLLMECLLRQPNLPVPRDELIRYAWPEKDAVDPASVNLVVARLRKKLEEHGFAAQLDTVNRYGYQLRML